MQDDASAAEKGLDLASVVPLTVQYAVDLVGDFYVVASQIATISLTSLQPLETFNSLVSTIANVHPYTQVALGVLTSAAQLIITQANLGDSVSGLLPKIQSVYESVF